MTPTPVKIKVNPLANDPTKLWSKLQVKQKQKELPIEDFTTKPLKQNQPDDGHVRFIFISDTHNATDNLELPPGDVLIHGGDFTRTGIPEQIEHFNDFLGKIKHNYKHVIVIGGNHEITFNPDGRCNASFRIAEKYQDLDPKEMKKKLTNCTFIEDESVEVMGFEIYGSPWQPEFHGWAYNLKRGEEMLEKWDNIPDDTDILITHGPPLGYGDLCSSTLRAGCSELLSTIQQRVKPLVHVFGHIHEAYGVWTDGGTTYINASTCTLRYKPDNLPIVMDIKSPNKKN